MKHISVFLLVSGLIGAGCASAAAPEGDSGVAHERLGIADASGGLYLSVKDLAQFIAVNQSAYPARDEPEQAPLRRAPLRESHQAKAALILGLSPPFTTPTSRVAEPWASLVGLAWNDSAALPAAKKALKNDDVRCSVGDFLSRDGNGWHRFRLVCDEGRTRAISVKVGIDDKVEHRIERDVNGVCDPELLTSD